MQKLVRGQNISINNFINKTINIQIKWECINDIDISIFMLEDNKIRDNK